MKWRPAKHSVSVARKMTIVNELGLHARPAAEFVRLANSFRSALWIVKDGKRFSATSLIDILRAELDCGVTAILEGEGEDAETAVERLIQLLPEFREQEKRQVRS
jgi:phosphocarrier protein HPr